MLARIHNELRYAVAIQKDDGSEFHAHASPCGCALFYTKKAAAAYKRELRPQFKCRVVPVKVTITEIKP
ncbi:MAG: hypothetical protein K9N47_05595 [Prosthecobacter sp.]|uniref:hypothetical protein n=1 Tax=Prosthecobacter sp. TaxID=1965333 RepID=UPI0025CF6C22|nr:hypothetical protein [Prosthecobacter sp.]MCF7785574.1 hypothetical protein [Prosthecobacter sp.]